MHLWRSLCVTCLCLYHFPAKGNMPKRFNIFFLISIRNKTDSGSSIHQVTEAHLIYASLSIPSPLKSAQSTSLNTKKIQGFSSFTNPSEKGILLIGQKYVREKRQTLIFCLRFPVVWSPTHITVKLQPIQKSRNIAHKWWRSPLTSLESTGGFA